MDSRFLETFVAVVEAGSMAEAARRLNLTASTVAQRIHALEDEIGTRLVFRSGRNVSPTAAAIAVFDRAKRFIVDVRDFRSAAISDQLTGQFRLGSMPTTVSGLLPDLITTWSMRHPQVEIRITRATSSALYQGVIDGDLDAAIIAWPPFAIPKSCSWQFLRSEPLTLLVPSAIQDNDPLAILQSEPFIRNERNTWAGKLVDGYLRHVGIRPRERFELAGIDLVAALVDRGLGVSLMHDTGPLWLTSLSIRKISLDAERFARRTGLLWSRASIRSRLVSTLVQEAIKAFTAKGTHASGRIPSRTRLR